MVSVRLMNAGDVEQATEILDSAFGKAVKRREVLCRYLELQPDGYLMACIQDQPVGMAGAINYKKFAYVGLVAVHVNWRRRGIGSLLMEEVIKKLEKEKCRVTILDATEMGAPIYESLGYRDDGTTLTFERKNGHSFDLHDHRIQVVEAKDIPALVKFDEPFFGANRERVFQAYRRDFPERLLMIRDKKGKIGGFILVLDGMLGPWVARSAEDAEALLLAALSFEFSRPIKVLHPSCNQTGISLLTRYGFQQMSELRHMIRGATKPPGKRIYIYGQASFAIG